jgi:hypothetical protein
MLKQIKYTCIKCNWQGSITELWGDLKPRRCPNKRCKTSFRKNPELLKVELPKKELIPADVTAAIEADANSVFKK